MSEAVALRAALAAEQAVIYGYGVAGAHLSGKAEKYAAARLVAHLGLRDRLTALIATAGAVAPPAQPAYRLPFPVGDATSAKQLAGTLENGAAGAAWDLVAAATAQSAARQLAIDWLADAASAAALWGAATAMPGQPAS